MTNEFHETPEAFEGARPVTAKTERKTVGKTKLKKIGNSLGVTLPKKFLDGKGLAEGDSFTIIEIEDGFKLVPYDAEFEHKMDIAKRIMREHRDVLRELAK